MKISTFINVTMWIVILFQTMDGNAEGELPAAYVMEKKIDNLPSGYETLKAFKQISENPGTNDWPGLRIQSAVEWVNVWNELESSIIPDYKRKPQRPFIPKTSQIWVSGMGPDAVDDPNERQEFIEHQKQKSINTRDNQAQRGFRKLKQMECHKFEDFLTSLYWLPPHDRTELEEVLLMIADIDLRTNVVNRLNEFGEYGKIEYSDVEPEEFPTVPLVKMKDTEARDSVQTDMVPPLEAASPAASVVAKEYPAKFELVEAEGPANKPSKLLKYIFPIVGFLIATLVGFSMLWKK